MKKVNKKHIALSVVALILILVTTVGVTYSWIDDVKLVEFQNDDLVDNGAPLKSGVDINSTVNITNNSNSIDLGNMLTNADLTYSYDDNGTQKSHAKYANTGNTAGQTPDWDYINKEKGYFYESGDMHLSGCYSDGETFYFPRQGVAGYREGNKDDENVNYISFTAQVSSPDANVDFWFKNEPSICKKGTNEKIENARFAINVDGKSHVYSSTGTALTCNSNLNGTMEVSGVRKTSEYTYDNDDNITVDRGKNSNTLFSIKKGATANMTIKIWLEDGFSTDVNVDINLELVSSWAYKRTITIVDRTTTNTTKSWLNNDNATMYLTCPSVLNEYAKKIFNGANVNLWQSITSVPEYGHAPFFKLTRNSSLSTSDYDVYSVEMPMVFNNEEMIIYRCSSAGWNNGSHNGKTGDYGVNYWNWWKSTIPNTYTTGVYTLYGGSHDEYAGYVVTDDSNKETYLGYGTWGDVVEISVEQNYNDINWASFGSSSDNVYIRDYTDYTTSGETYVHSMYWDSTKNLWTATIPKSSYLIQFLYTQNSVIKGCYGYRSYNDKNPQQRPLDSVKYHFVFKNDKDNNVNGIGYWTGANHVYLIKDGDFANAGTLDTYFFYKYNANYAEHTVQNKAFPGTGMTKISDKYNTFDVYQSDELNSSNNVNVYPDRRKSNASDTKDMISVDTTVIFNNGSSSTQTSDLILYPGCYYKPSTNEWLGSLTGTGRPADTSGGGGNSGGGGDVGGGTIAGYTTETDFVFKINNTEYKVYTNGSNYKVRIPLNVGDNWTTILKGSNNFGNERSGQQYNTQNGMDLYLSSSYNNNISFTTLTSGNYIATFQWENSNTIKITSVLKES